MDRFSRVELTSTLRPVLNEGETILAIQDNVGLYDGNEKAAGYMNGKVYLTSHRIIYVDSEQPNTNSIGVEIRFIKGREFYTGFVKSSPKITLKFSESNNNNSSPFYHQLNDSSTSTLSSASSTWICPICSYSNTPQIFKCQLCGVKKTENLASITPPPASSLSNTSASSQQQITTNQTSPIKKTQGDTGIECPQCTFLNHPDMVICEICDAELGTNIKINEEEILGSRVGGKSKDDFIRLAFRNGGAGTFYDKMKQAITMKEWEKTIEPSKSPIDFDPVRGGISGIMRNAEENKKEQDEYLNQAFKDLESLKTITEKMESAESEEVSTFKTNLFKLGISNPVTKDEAGSIYHKELARELAEFLENTLDKDNGMMSLTDIYCIFNRARGVALISPNDLYKACSLFERLNLPLRLRKYESGLLVVHDDQIAQRILEYIKLRGSLSGIELASIEQKSVVLVNEQLQMVEAKGLICRDESIEGIRYYDNLINHFVWER
ncbi:10832_t:CDS:10 [Funneliformis geosporum]|uniref:Vacuolar protein-sorting-associated protein 36 n=1 Tax=Funneliformis geosporum TaxID=1117311 RepID=A0A9W4WU59_9GLOM|nr:10832_t:CDS:10 [Funneliformis geosporum]